MSDKTYTSGALANIAGISKDTLRHYERKGVLARPRRGPNGYREYQAEALERVQLIRRALAVGFTLDELAEILQVRDRGGTPCAEVRQLATLKLADVEVRLTDLNQLGRGLRTTLQDWDTRLANRRDSERAHLLKNLPPSSSSTVRKGVSLKPYRKGRK